MLQEKRLPGNPDPGPPPSGAFRAAAGPRLGTASPACAPREYGAPTAGIGVVLCALLLLAGWAAPVLSADPTPGGSPDLRGRKVFYLDSYDAAYQPSIFTQKGARAVLEPAGVVMEVFYLDEKNNPSEATLRAAAERARRRIEEWKPDLIIAADDPANKYVIVPWYKGSDLPVVFNGVNWDASPYGYPARNVTGQVEVELVSELLAELRAHSRGPRVGVLSGDTSTDRLNLAYYENILGLTFDSTVLVTRFDRWKEAYAAFQKDVDLLFLRSNGGIEGWNDGEAVAFVMSESRIPSGSVAPHMGPFVLLNFAKVREESGEYSARTALRILRGTSPADIPLSTNRQARVLVNMRLAKALGIRLPIDLLERATFVEDGGP